MAIPVASLKNNCLSKFLERMGKMSASTTRLQLCDLEERFILSVPSAAADVLNSSKQTSSKKPLTIMLDDDMKSGEVFVNGKKLYGKMVNMTCLYASDSTVKKLKNWKPVVMPQVLVCQEQKYKTGSSVNGSFFSIQTEVKPNVTVTKHKFRRVLSKCKIPVAGVQLQRSIERIVTRGTSKYHLNDRHVLETKKRTKRAKRKAS